jgi:hypothetical protein
MNMLTSPNTQTPEGICLNVPWAFIFNFNSGVTHIRVRSRIDLLSVFSSLLRTDIVNEWNF